MADRTEYIKSLPVPKHFDKIGDAEEYARNLYSALSRWNFRVPPTGDNAEDLTGLVVRPEWFDKDVGTGGDDTAAIQAAIDAVELVKGTVVFGPHVYQTTGLTIDSPFVSLVGSAKGSTILNTGTGTAIKLSNASRFILRNLMIWGNGGAFGVGSTTTYGVELDASSYVIFDTCDIRYNGSHGVYCHGGVWNTSFIDTHILENAGDGINSRSPSGAEQNGNNMSLLNCAIWDNGANGINWLAANLNITGSNIESNMLAGLNVDPAGCASTAFGLCVVGNYLELNRQAQIHLGTITGWSIYGGEISGNYLYSSYAGTDGGTALIVADGGESPISLLHIGYNACYMVGAKLTHWVDLGNLPNFTCRVEQMGMPDKFTNLGTATGQNQGDLDAIDQGLSMADSPTFEDIKLSSLSAGAIPCNNANELFVNGDFSSGTANWEVDRCTISSIPGGVDGENCLELTMVSGDSQYAYQTVTGLEIGETYYLSAWVKSGTSGDEPFTLKVSDYAPFASGVSSGTWTKYSVAYPAIATTHYPNLRKESATAGTMLFSKASFVKLLGVGDSPLSSDGTDVNNSGSYKVSGTKVVGEQQPAIADATSGTIVAQFNTLLSEIRTHGIIAT